MFRVPKIIAMRCTSSARMGIITEMESKDLRKMKDGAANPFIDPDGLQRVMWRNESRHFLRNAFQAEARGKSKSSVLEDPGYLLL